MNRYQFNSPFSQNSSPDARWRSSFGESLSPDFIPFEYSSPLSSYKQNSSQKFRGYYKNNRMRVYDKSFSSPSSASSANSSFNNSFNQCSYSNKKHNSSQKSWYKRRNNNDKYDTSLYYHESMIEDPWEYLEKKLIEEGEIKIDENDSEREESNAIDRSNLDNNSSNHSNSSSSSSSNIITKHKNCNKEKEKIQKDNCKAVSEATVSTTETIPASIDSTNSDL